jgi:hypothetical protein
MAADLPPTDATPTQSAPPPTPPPAPTRRFRARGGLLTALVIVEGILLFLSTGVTFVEQWPSPGALYNGGSPTVDWQALAFVLGLAALASFVLPVVIGMLAPSWRSAVALPILATWIALALFFLAALIFKSPASIRYLPAISPFGFPGAYWLSYTVPAAALLAFLLFGALGWAGWAARGGSADHG